MPSEGGRSKGTSEVSDRQALQGMYRITSGHERSFGRKVSELLRLGCVYLDVEAGFLTEISGETQYVVETTNSRDFPQPGDFCPLAITYCRKTIEREDTLTVHHASAEGWEDDIAYETFGLESYIGAKVVVEGEVYGTFCFGDLEPRDRPFSETEETFVELMAQWVSSELFRQRAAELIQRQHDALASEQEFTERALDALKDVFFVLNADGVLVRTNETVGEVTGYSKDEILSMTATDFFVPEDRGSVARAVENCIETGSATVEATLLTKDGVRRQYEFRAERLSGSDGELAGVAGIGRDITKQSLSEERLEVALRVLRHNLRNSVNITNGYAELLCERASEGSQRDAAEKIVGTLNRLQDLSRKAGTIAALSDDTDRGTPTDLVERTTAIVEGLEESYPAATIETRLSTEAEEDLTVPGRFEPALANAVENAIEHNPDEEPWVRVSMDEMPGAVRIRVEDTGPGIPESEWRVLEHGETPLEHGSGVGLWVVHWSMMAIGGEASVEKRDPTGTTLSLTVPLVR